MEFKTLAKHFTKLGSLDDNLRKKEGILSWLKSLERGEKKYQEEDN